MVRAGQSLQAYVRYLLEGEAAMLTAEEAAEQACSIAVSSSAGAVAPMATATTHQKATPKPAAWSAGPRLS